MRHPAPSPAPGWRQNQRSLRHLQLWPLDNTPNFVTGHAVVTRSRFCLVTRPCHRSPVTCHVASRLVSRLKTAQSLGKHGLVTVSRVKTPPRQTNSPAITNVKCYKMFNSQFSIRPPAFRIRVHSVFIPFVTQVTGFVGPYIVESTLENKKMTQPKI